MTLRVMRVCMHVRVFVRVLGTGRLVNTQEHGVSLTLHVRGKRNWVRCIRGGGQTRQTAERLRLLEIPNPQTKISVKTYSYTNTCLENFYIKTCTNTWHTTYHAMVLYMPYSVHASRRA